MTRTWSLDQDTRNIIKLSGVDKLLDYGSNVGLRMWQLDKALFLQFSSALLLRGQVLRIDRGADRIDKRYDVTLHSCS